MSVSPRARVKEPQLGKGRDSVSYLISAADVATLVGRPLKGVFSDILTGGKRQHPLKYVDRFRWDPATDTYIIKPDKSPALLLKRQSGRWVIRFDVQSRWMASTPLFEDDSLNDPIYTPVAIIYAIQVATYPALRKLATERLAALGDELQDLE